MVLVQTTLYLLQYNNDTYSSIAMIYICSWKIVELALNNNHSLTHSYSSFYFQDQYIYQLMGDDNTVNMKV